MYDRTLTNTEQQKKNTEKMKMKWVRKWNTGSETEREREI